MGSIQKQRESGTELLRIICMLMILSLHSFSAKMLESNDAILLNISRESLCIGSVNAFVLISGFYSIRWKAKSLFSFVFQVYFYSIVLFLICWALGFTEPSNIFRIGSRFVFPFLNWWFVTSYMLLYLVSPLLNKTFEKLPSWGTILLIGGLYFISLVFDFRMIFLFSVLYLIGRLLHRNHELLLNVNYRVGYCFAYLFFIIVITMIVYHYYDSGLKDNAALQFILFGESYYNPFVILQAVALFLFVTSFKFNNKTVNKIAVSAFAVYLLHMHPDIKNFYYGYTQNLYNCSTSEHIVLLIAIFIGVFAISIIFDQFRLKSFDYIYPKLSTLLNKLKHE